MPALLFLLLLLGAASPLAAKPAAPAWVQVASPDREETWPWGNLKQSYWRVDDGALALVLTYSNENLADRSDPRREEDLTFHFPAARYDAASASYGLPSGSGRRVVALRSRGFVKSTVLVPNAVAVVLRTGANVKAFLFLASSGHRFSRGVIETTRPGPSTLQALLER